MSLRAPPGHPAIAVEDVSKAFGGGPLVVDSIRFSLAAGTGLGLLGANGAGKSTLLKIVNGFYRPSAGTVRVFGHDVGRHPRRARHRIGVAPQEDTLDPELTVAQNLWFTGRYRGLSSCQARSEAIRLLAEVGLAERAADGVAELSSGLRRRLVLARALLGDPPVLLLDEPTRGLDQEGRAWFLECFLKRKAAGVSLLLATHDRDEARVLCDRIARLEGGRLEECAAADPLFDSAAPGDQQSRAAGGC